MLVNNVATFGENVRRLREERGFKQGVLAERLGVGQGQLSNWESDRFGLPETATVLKIAKALQCSVEELLQGVDPAYDDQVARAVLAYEEQMDAMRMLLRETKKTGLPEDTPVILKIPGDILRRRLQRQEDEVEDELVDVTGFKREEIPVIAEGAATPQPGLFWEDSGALKSDVEERLTRPYDVKDPRAYGVKVRGDSMMPRFKPGDVVVVSPNIPIADGDEAYVELLSGERLIKVVRKLPGGWLLESYNPAHESRHVKRAEIGTLHPIVWIRPKRRSERRTTAVERPSSGETL